MIKISKLKQIVITAFKRISSNSSLDDNACLDIVCNRDKFKFLLSYRGKLSDQMAISFNK